MSVDWKHKKELLDAWKKVTEHEDEYDWALYGYEGRSNVLKLVSFIFHKNFLLIFKGICHYSSIFSWAITCYLYFDKQVKKPCLISGFCAEILSHQKVFLKVVIFPN